MSDLPSSLTFNPWNHSTEVERPGEHIRIMPERSEALARDGPPAPPRPQPMFFYGTLSIPHVLQRVLDLPEPPHLIDGFVYGFQKKMWGPYPALLQLTSSTDLLADYSLQEQSRVDGKVWLLPPDAETIYLRRLDQYETGNYRRVKTLISYPDGSRVDELGYVYTWNSYPEQLEEGAFDASQFPA